MKGTIYLWILAAVLVGALVGYLGFVIQAILNLPSSFMGPIIMGAIAGAVSVLVTIGLFREQK
jgi:ABC-type enterobactin transport system permease subunit